MKTEKRTVNKNTEILVVEDSPTQAEELKHLLEEGGYKIKVAVNGNEALEAACKHKPILVISDIVMPEMNGFELCKKIKSNEELKDIPVVLVTSLSGAQDVMKGLECGADNFLRKPYNKQYLLSRIDYILMNRELRKNQKMQMAVEIYLGGQKHIITSERQQIVDLLISIYEEALHMNEELKVQQKKLAHSNQSLSGLYRIAVGLNGATSEQDVADKALERAMELPNVQAAWIALQEDNTNFRTVSHRNLPPALDVTGRMEGDCLCRRKFISGELDQAVNIYECERLNGTKGDTSGLSYHASIPLWIGKRKLGIMNLVGAEQGSFSDEDLKTLYGVGNQVAIALERAQLYQHLEAKVEERTMSLRKEIAERQKAEEMVQHMAYYDTLTELPNRNMLYDRLLNAVRTDKAEGKPMAILLMDLDHFKEINDTLGHHRGDILLQQVGSRLQSLLFKPDIVTRLGGDEFAILVPNLAKTEDINLVIQKIQDALQPPFMIEGLPVAVEASIGVALYPDHGENPDSLLQRADIAMYAAKQTGSGYIIYDAKHDQHSPRRLALIGELRQAIEKDQLFLHYQPKISFKTHHVIGVEALVRWQHPEYGFVPPDQFILPAEQTGLIHPLTRWVLKTALRQSQAWRQAGLDIPVSVNLSARNLHDPQISIHFAELLRTFGGSPELLELEITESAIMADPHRALDAITRLKAMGLRFALDDFGVGYSSLAYLKKLPVDTIKIDKSFVIDMAKDEDDVLIVLSTINLAHNLGLKVVAEGVETEKVWDRLFAFGCDAAQGYYMSKPLPVADLNRWLKESSWGLKKKN